VTLVLSIANLSPNDFSEPYEAELRDQLAKVLPDSKMELKDFFSVGPNVVSVWSTPTL
jgi:hypothetical protein